MQNLPSGGTMGVGRNAFSPESTFSGSKKIAMSSISRQRLFNYFLLKYSDYFLHPVISRSGWYLLVREGYSRWRFLTVPSNQASLRQHRVASGSA